MKPARTTVRAGLAAAVATALIIAATPTAAWAITCSVGELCFYDSPTGAGASLMYDHDGADRPGCIELPGSYDNRTSYIFNRTGQAFEVYIGDACGSFTHAFIYPNSQGPMTGTWDNNIESFYAY